MSPRMGMGPKTVNLLRMEARRLSGMMDQKWQIQKRFWLTVISKDTTVFLLGRYHRDAQFYLVNCAFAKNMRDSAIYRVQNANILQWGHRVYYYNCHREGGNDFKWYANNLPVSVKATDINIKWVFKNRWNPEEN